MAGELFFILYIGLLALMVAFEMYVLFNNKRVYIRRSCRGLEAILFDWSDKREDIGELAKEIEQFYSQYCQERPETIRVFPNIIAWINAIIFRINSGEIGNLKKYNDHIKSVRDVLESKYPFSRCDKYQQNILTDMEKLKSEENEGAVGSILKRTEEEFLRLSGEIRKNSANNTISLLVGIFGILISVLMAFAKL